MYEGSEFMKIIIEDDGCKEISVIQKEKVSYPWEGKHCGECRYFHRHYALIDSDNNSYCPLPQGHCYPPKIYFSRKEHFTCDDACTWFKPDEPERR